MNHNNDYHYMKKGMKNNLASPEEKINLAIVGAGPHALTLVTHLLQKRVGMQRKIAVFDSSGTWMSRWYKQFAALEIPHLRSPAVHHPDPNPFALRKFAESRPNEFFPPYDLPATELFWDFCQDVICRYNLQNQVHTGSVIRLEPLPHILHPRFRLWLENGKTIIAHQVVLAIGSNQLQIPDWVSQIQSPYPEDRLCHSNAIDLRKLQLAGSRVLIVGGGLTSGHLAVGALSRSALVEISIRRELQEKFFDAEPGWLGPKYLSGFRAEPDWEKRWELIQQARNGGSMTPAMVMQLQRQVRSGKLKIHQNCQVKKAEWLGNNWLVQFTHGKEYNYDYIWLSTGTQFNANSEPLLRETLEVYPIPIVKGLPVLDSHLRWRGCSLFIMGGLAALQIGPTARNLSGARMASEKIVSAIIKHSIGDFQKIN
jgi:hypothetical protein